MRVQHEDAATFELCRAAVDDSDARVAVFHGRRKCSCLKRRGHARAFARRHAPLEDERFGAAADAAEQRAHGGLVRGGRRNRLGPDLTPAGGGDPECASLVARHALTI